MEGNYACSCAPGFRMIEERCAAEGPTPFVLFANGPDVRAIDYEQQQQHLVVTSQSRTQSIDFDPVEKVIYWTDTYEKRIKRSYVPDFLDEAHGSDLPQELLVTGLNKPTDLAIDWIGR